MSGLHNPVFYAALMLVVGLGIPIFAALNGELGSKLQSPALAATTALSVGVVVSICSFLYSWHNLGCAQVWSRKCCYFRPVRPTRFDGGHWSLQSVGCCASPIICTTFRRAVIDGYRSIFIGAPLTFFMQAVITIKTPASCRSQTHYSLMRRL